MSVIANYTNYTDLGLWVWVVLSGVVVLGSFCVVTTHRITHLKDYEVTYTRVQGKLHKLHKRHTKKWVARGCVSPAPALKVDKLPTRNEFTTLKIPPRTTLFHEFCILKSLPILTILTPKSRTNSPHPVVPP